VIHARFGGGFYVAPVPTSLSEEHLDAALNEIGIDAEEVIELGGWQTSDNVAVAYVPPLEEN